MGVGQGLAGSRARGEGSYLSSPEWTEIRRIFEAVLERPPAERVAFLDAACAGDPAVRAEVASLLEAHDGAGEFIEAPAAQVAAHLLTDLQPDLFEGQVLGSYIIRHEIGRGGMGIVYLADDTRLSRRVALKAIAAGATAGQDRRRERMRHEARAAAALSHPGIATVYALEEIDDQLYLAYEYVPGPTLRTLISGGPLPVEQVLDIATQLARALAAAHAQGIVHRDLKPENIIRTPAGMVKVLDFGIARSEQLTGARLTEPEARIGTPAYMAPEQIRGEDVDFRADLFAFGVLVYEMASGANPFEASSPTSTIARILELKPSPLSTMSHSGLGKLDQIVAMCLRKSPDDRYTSTQQLVGDLEGLNAGAHSPASAVRLEHAWTPKWWWGVHQLVVTTLYLLMLYPAWRVRAWLPQPWGILFMFLVLTCAAVAATVRLHLWFTGRFYPSELTIQRNRARSWTRASDLGFSATLLLAAFAIAVSHPEIATLLIAVSVAGSLSSFLIEPATTRAAFGES
jgi:serine/threonine protein kinase